MCGGLCVGQWGLQRWLISRPGVLAGLPSGWSVDLGPPGGLSGGCLRLAFIYRGCPTHIQEWICNIEHMPTTQLKQRQKGEPQDWGERQIPRNPAGGGPACSRRRPHPRGPRCAPLALRQRPLTESRIPGGVDHPDGPDGRGYARNLGLQQIRSFPQSPSARQPHTGEGTPSSPTQELLQEWSRCVTMHHFLMP